jgi:hypothetical protein
VDLEAAFDLLTRIAQSLESIEQMLIDRPIVIPLVQPDDVASLLERLHAAHPGLKIIIAAPK